MRIKRYDALISLLCDYQRGGWVNIEHITCQNETSFHLYFHPNSRNSTNEYIKKGNSIDRNNCMLKPLWLRSIHVVISKSN